MPLLEPERMTMPEMLKEHGYATLCIGKWHLGMKWARKDGAENPADAVRIADEEIDLTKPITEGPLTAGFDYYFGTAVPNFPPYCFLENDHIVGPIPDRPKPDSMHGNPGRMQEGWRLDRILGGLADKATEKIHEHHTQHADQPLFLYMPLTAPHTPISPSEAFRGKTEATLYGDFVAEVDHCVGRVMKALDDAGMADNTLVVFTSDNGSPGRNGENASGPTGSCFRDSGHNPSGPWRGMKADIHEGGHRVPFIVRWPGKTPAGVTSDALICHVDLMSTIAAIVGHELPEACAEDSFCMLPLFRGEKLEKPIRETVVHHSGNGLFAVRAGDWKLVLGKGSGGFTKVDVPKDAPAGQLFNLADDPAEANNLYEQRPEIVERLTGLKEKYVADGRTRP
jgi:arylsulfatase A-like enzyme